MADSVSTSRWQGRLDVAVLVAALASVPAVFLHASKGTAHDVGVWLGWFIWLVFATEIAVMLSITSDRRAWARGHQFELFVFVTSFPLFLDLPGVRELIGVFPVLGAVKLLKALKILKLVKVFRLLHSSSLAGWIVRLATAAGAVVALGLLGAIVTEKKVPTPAHGVDRLGDELAKVFDAPNHVFTVVLIAVAIGGVEWWAWSKRRITRGARGATPPAATTSDR